MKTTSSGSSANWYLHQRIHSSSSNSKPWTKEDNKKFEEALAIFDERTPNRWFKVAEMIPGKSVEEVINQYRVLVADVSDIEAGLVPVPGYFPPSFKFEFDEEEEDHRRAFDTCRKRCRIYDQERRKGVPWTAEEHRLFLLGLVKHGKGDWRNISRNFVVSKTPTQVASHAQKYYQRQLSSGKDRRRPSIHDITTFDLDKARTYLEKSDDGLDVKNPNVSKKMVMGLDDDNPMKVFVSDFFISNPHDVLVTRFAHPMINI